MFRQIKRSGFFFAISSACITQTVKSLICLSETNEKKIISMSTGCFSHLISNRKGSLILIRQ